MDNQKASLPSFSNLLSRTWQAYKQNLKTLVGLSTLPFLTTIPLLVLFGLVTGLLKDYMSLLGRADWGLPLSGVGIIGLVAVVAIFLGLAFFIVSLWSRSSILYAVKERETGLGIIDSLKKGWKTIIPFFVVSILSTLVVFAGFLLFFIPGIIFAIWFSFGPYVLVRENLKGINALKRSKQLVSGYWWQVLGRNLLLILIIFGVILMVALAVVLPINIMLTVLKMSALEEILQNIINGISGIFISPFALVFSVLLYEDLKRAKEGDVIPEQI